MAQSSMKAWLSQSLAATVDWDFETSSNPSEYDVIVAFGAQFRSEAYLVNTQDGFLGIDQCDSSKNISLYGSCDYPAFLQPLQDARSNGTTVIAVTFFVLFLPAQFPDFFPLLFLR